jgi:hypothetical protein
MLYENIYYSDSTSKKFNLVEITIEPKKWHVLHSLPFLLCKRMCTLLALAKLHDQRKNWLITGQKAWKLDTAQSPKQSNSSNSRGNTASNEMGGTIPAFTRKADNLADIWSCKVQVPTK